MTIDLVNILDSQNTRNGISEDQEFKIFWGRMPPDRPSGSSLQHWPYQKNILVIPITLE